MKQINNLLRYFGSDQRGVFAVTFALVAIVLVATTGAVVDFVAIQNARSLSQSTLDSTTLALHSQVDNKTEAELLSLAQNLLNERMATIDLSANVETVNIDIDEGTLFIEARFAVPTSFLSLVGISTINTRISSEVTSKSLNIEVALVLDNTGSMAGRKLDALKEASNLLINELMPDDTNPDIKIGIVPFNRYVNIGRGNRNEPGLDIDDDYTYRPPGQSCRNTYPDSTRRCDSRRETYECTRDGVPATCRRTVYFNCTGTRGERVRVCTPRSTQNYRWRGCMASRHIRDLDTIDSDYQFGVPGVVWRWNTCRVRPLTQLTSDRDTLRRAVRAMYARDNTYIPTGLMWGWRILSPGIPFTDGVPYDGENKKIIVLMTDGRNTVSPSTRWSPNEPAGHRIHRGNNAGIANTKTEEICTNVKREDIIVYTIAFEVDDNNIRDILSDCAGNGGRYFDAGNSAELQRAFADIADDLQNLRVSR
ncbi:MAG: hypothetical protein L3J21_00070 [Devosiaceae bacterium]|nr:hypothetical protein [Devosiaceae bacterium]